MGSAIELRVRVAWVMFMLFVSSSIYWKSIVIDPSRLSLDSSCLFVFLSATPSTVYIFPSGEGGDDRREWGGCRPHPMGVYVHSFSFMKILSS